MDDMLAQVPLFRTLPQSELNDLAPTCELRRFHKGETIFAEGQPADAVWVVKHGWVALIKGTPDGGRATIFAMTSAEPLCGISAFEHGTYSATAIASTDTQLIKIPAEAFSRLLDHDPALARQVLAICCQRIRRMAEAISLAQSPVEQRIAYVLLRLRRTFGKTIPLTHQELAQMAGTRWETSIRTLSSFKRKRWLATSRGKITVLRPDQLKGLLRPSASEGPAPSSNGCVQQKNRKDDVRHGSPHAKGVAYHQHAESAVPASGGSRCAQQTSSAGNMISFGPN